MQTKRQDGRVALVTGAAGGLGPHFVERLAQDGCDLVVTDIADCPAAVAKAEAAGRRGLAVKCDLTDPAAVDALVETAIGHFGRVDILINNASDLGQSGATGEATPALFRRSLAINLEAPYLLSTAVAAHMGGRGWGRIVNIVTGSAWAPSALNKAMPFLVGYVSSKMGLVGLTRALAGSLASAGVTVNALAPALTRSRASDQAPQAFWDLAIGAQMIQRACQPEDLAGVLSFLCSEDSAFVTGQVYHVDGGATL